MAPFTTDRQSCSPRCWASWLMPLGTCISWTPSASVISISPRISSATSWASAPTLPRPLATAACDRCVSHPRLGGPRRVRKPLRDGPHQVHHPPRGRDHEDGESNRWHGGPWGLCIFRGLPRHVIAAADAQSARVRRRRQPHRRDSGNHIIRSISPQGMITTIAGQPGVPGSAEDGGAATSAKLHSP